MNRATISACICYNEDFSQKTKFVDQTAEMRHVLEFLIFQIPPENMRGGGDKSARCTGTENLHIT